MNFKRYNGRTWETVRHKIYGSGTDSLTAFPAVIQASGEPLTDYTIYGNTVQNGTPTPEAPVDVVGCGVWDETHQSCKLTPTVNGTEYPVYLGQVETTRRIKKLVLTGEEDWYESGSWGKENTAVYYMTSTGGYSPSANVVYVFCDHYSAASRNELYNNDSECAGFTGVASLTFRVSRQYAGTKADFKSYLAAQYANGTPVTVWYVLEEPETAVVNEPIHKIGNYADTITMAQAEVTIPTSDGDNTITFGTTVKPSAMSATFKGWHPVKGAKQYDGSEWR